MTTPAYRHRRKQPPILARHAVSLLLAFVMSLVLSYFVGQYFYQQVQLNKLMSADRATFERGVGYVLSHAGRQEAVAEEALDSVTTLGPKRAGDLLLAIAQSHAKHNDREEPVIPNAVNEAAARLMQRSDPFQAIGLYDGLVKIKGVDAIKTANALLVSLNPEDDAELFQVVDLLDTRLLWSTQWAPLELWVRWLSVLAESKDELTQYNTVLRLGALPDAVDDSRVGDTLSTLASSPYERVRNKVLHVVAGYAAIAENPTDYEQIIFMLGQDENQHIARRAWMIVGHLKPFSGFAVNWKDADPFVTEAMLWAAAMTNPENPKPAVIAFESPAHQLKSLHGLSHAAKAGNKEIEWLLIAERFKHWHQSTSLFFWRLISASPRSTKPRMDGDYNILGHWLGHTNFPESVREVDWDHDLNLLLAMAHLYSELPNYEHHDPALFQLAAVEGRPQLQDFDSNEVWIEKYPPLMTTYDFIEYPKEILVTGGAAGVPLEADDFDLEKLDLSTAVFRDLMVACLSVQMAHGVEALPLADWLSSNNTDTMTVAALLSAMEGAFPKLTAGFTADLIRKNPGLGVDQIRAMTDPELAELGLSRIDALHARLDAAESAPPSARRAGEAKLLQLALWMRGDLGDSFTPAAEAMLLDEDVPTSTVLMCLLHKRRPIALDYLFGDLVTPRPDLRKLFIHERYWHVFRRFVDTSDLTLWLWGDPESQAFQLDAMRQWYAVNRWKIEDGWWPDVIDD